MGGGIRRVLGYLEGGGGFGGGSQLTCRKDRAHSRALRCRIARCCFSSPPMGQLSLKHSASGQPCGPPPTPPPLPGSATVSPATAPMGGTRGRHPKGHGRMGTWGWGHSPGCWGGREDQPPPSCRGAAARGCAGSAPMGRVGDSAVCHLPPARCRPHHLQVTPLSPPMMLLVPHCHPMSPGSPSVTQCHPMSPAPVSHRHPVSPVPPRATQCHSVPIPHCSLLPPSVTQCPQ